MARAFDRLKNNGPTGPLDAIEDITPQRERYEAARPNEAVSAKQKEEKSSGKQEERIIRSYSLTKKQLKLLQMRKLDEIDLSLSDIVGKAIEYYCENAEL